MNKLLQNERTKLYKKVSTWILMGVIVALMLFTLGIVKLSNVLMSSGGGTTWRENYEWNYTYAQRNADSDPMSYAEAQKFKYLLDNDIPPSDWRTDLVSSYWDQYKRVELEALEQLKTRSWRRRNGPSWSCRLPTPGPRWRKSTPCWRTTTGGPTSNPVRTSLPPSPPTNWGNQSPRRGGGPD